MELKAVAGERTHRLFKIASHSNGGRCRMVYECERHVLDELDRKHY